MLRRKFLTTIGAAAALAFAAIPGLARADVPTSQVPASLESAIESHVESKGHDYAGLCREVNANPPLPFGEYCAFVFSIEHDIAEVSYGPVASNDLTFISFHNEGGQWKLMTSSTPVPSPTAIPTNTPQPSPTAVPTNTPQPSPTAIPTTTPPAIPPALVQAVKAHIELLGKSYAGLCTDVNQLPTPPYGKYCAFITVVGTMADVSFGPVATNDITRVSFRQEGTEWKLITGATKTPTAPLPPNTGSGGASDGPGGEVAVFGLAAAAVVVGAASVVRFARR